MALENMGEQKGYRRRGWSWILSVLLAAALMYFAVRGVEWRRVWEAITHVEWTLIAAGALLSCGSYFLRALRWRILLNAEGRFSVGTVFSANMAGYLGNNFLPARAGELVRTWIISSQSSLSKPYVLTTALAERMVDAVVLVAWGSVVLLGIHPKPAWLASVSWTTTTIAAIGVLSIAVVPHTGNLCEGILKRLPMPAGLRERLLHWTGQILAGLRVFHDVGRLGRFAAMTVAIWSVDTTALMAAGKAFDLHMTVQMASLLLCGLGLGSAVAPTPGYVGTFQSVTVTVLGPFGVSRDAALAFALVSQATGYVIVVTLGLPAVLRYRGRAERDASADAVGRS
jgi:uncharacterized protein (TIRG00374 family)